ncbi:MAG: GrpB family protein [Kineosporiaceae bacterium]
MRVPVVPYDPAWVEAFERIRSEVLSALGEVAVDAVEHVGSTAVVGLVAKPVIDVDVVVPEHQVEAAIVALGAIGYRHRGELGIPDRHAFRAPAGGPARHVYVCVAGSLALRNHLAVRDTLRRDAGLRAEYAAVKCALAERDLDSMDEYLAGKNAVLHKILDAAGLASDEIGAIAAVNPAEWVWKRRQGDYAT